MKVVQSFDVTQRTRWTIDWLLSGTMSRNLSVHFSWEFHKCYRISEQLRESTDVRSVGVFPVRPAACERRLQTVCCCCCCSPSIVTDWIDVWREKIAFTLSYGRPKFPWSLQSDCCRPRQLMYAESRRLSMSQSCWRSGKYSPWFIYFAFYVVRVTTRLNIFSWGILFCFESFRRFLCRKLPIKEFALTQSFSMKFSRANSLISRLMCEINRLNNEWLKLEWMKSNEND